MNKHVKPIEIYTAERFALKEKFVRSEMEREDLLSKYTVMKQINEEEQEKHIELKDIKNEYFFLMNKDKELQEKITMLQPLLKDFILEIGENNKSENLLDDWINTMRRTLEDWIISEEKFQKAAKYDVKEHFEFERAIRQPGTKK